MKMKEALRIYELLSQLYPNASTELIYKNPFQLLVAVVLSAQCTDVRVNQTTPSLFARYPDARALARADLSEIEKLIHSCGFFRMKAKALKTLSQDLLDRFRGNVPGSLDALVTLRGVGRKTASVVLNQAFDEPAIAVDTHVSRVSQRLGWTRAKTPEKIEMDLRRLFPSSHWGPINGMLIFHGRRVCKARKPLCDDCQVRQLCAYYRNYGSQIAPVHAHTTR